MPLLLSAVLLPRLPKGAGGGDLARTAAARRLPLLGGEFGDSVGIWHVAAAPTRPGSRTKMPAMAMGGQTLLNNPEVRSDNF